eukprot:COSAG02_NODE_18155_length_957_cov_1.244755_1_plen_166_part_00
MVVTLPRNGLVGRVADLISFDKHVRGAPDEKATIRIRIVPTKHDVAIHVGRPVHNCKDVAVKLHRIATGPQTKWRALVFCPQTFHHIVAQELIHQVRIDERIRPVVRIRTALPPSSKSTTSLHRHADNQVVDAQAIKLKRTHVFVVRFVEDVLAPVQHLQSLQCC